MGESGDTGDGGPANEAHLSTPIGLAYDSKGNLYVADTGNLTIRKIATDGTISRVAGTYLKNALVKLIGYKVGADEGTNALDAVLVGPASIQFDKNDNLYLSEMGTENISTFASFTSLPVDALPAITARIRKITPDGKISSVAGVGTKVLADPFGDNSLSIPLDVCLNADGDLAIADSGLNQIKVLPRSAL
jgi:hypothetical protein